MADKKRYGIASLHKQFSNDMACLEFIFDIRHRRTCVCRGTYRKIPGRRQYQCSKCRSHIAPAAGTMFNKSRTPLFLWFHAILSYVNARGEITAKQLERDLEVTYKCAWRILVIIRAVLGRYVRDNSGRLTFMDTLEVAIRSQYPFTKSRNVRKSRRRHKTLAQPRYGFTPHLG